MATYMQIDGINGNVTAKGHENWIELKTVNFNVKRSISTDPGRIMNREGSKPAISEVTVTKRMDNASSLLFGESTVGKANPKLLIDMCSTDDKLTPFATLTLNNAIVSGYNLDTTDVEHPMETITFSFDKIELKYTPRDASNKPGSPIPAGYDLATAAAA